MGRNNQFSSGRGSKAMKKPLVEKVKALFTAAIVGGCSILWLQGFLASPLWRPEIKMDHDILKNNIANNNVDYSREKRLAKAYWLRYKDIMNDPYWGENGPQGIWGARDHYRLYGKKEGRVFGVLPQVENSKKEQELAIAYWLRYPDIAQSAVWGAESQLGILGPRDHYFHVGRWQGRVWGISEKE